MKTIIRPLLIAALLSAACPFNSSAPVVGYYNYKFFQGDNLFQDNLLGSPADLNTIFSTTPPPDGTTIGLWNPTHLAYDTFSHYSSGSWSSDFTLTPGTGALLIAPTTFTNTFVGQVVNHDGSLYTGATVPAPPFAGPNGAYLMGDAFIASSSGTNLFANVIGRLPNDQEQVIRLDAATQTYVTSTYDALSGTWDITPTSSIGDAVFFNVGPIAFTPPALIAIPEPSVAALALFGLCLLRVGVRRRA